MIRMSEISWIAMWTSIADSAPNDEVITRSDPNWAADHFTMSTGDCRSKSGFNVSRSRSSACCVVLMGRLLLFLLRRSAQLLADPVQENSRNPPAVGDAHADVLLVGPVEIAAAGL